VIEQRGLDVLIVGGTVVDGSGSPARRADVGIIGDRIAFVGHVNGASAARIVDASGKVVTPGIIDIHTHADFTMLEEKAGRSSLRQGVTTEVVGNCGQSYAPITERNEDTVSQRSLAWQPSVKVTWRTVGEYLQQVGRDNGVNCYFLVGHNAVRTAVMGFDERPAMPHEIEAMAALVEAAMDEGARGLSFGLEYPPARAASAAEQTALAAVVGRRGGFLGCHMKNRDVDFEPNLDEILGVAHVSGARLQLSHFTAKPGTPDGAWERILVRVAREREDGLDLGLDVYPYHTGPGFATAFLPDWAVEGGPDGILRRLADPEARERIRHDYDRYWRFVAAGEWDRLSLAYSGAHPDWIGEGFDVLAGRLGIEPIDVLLRLFEDEGVGLGRVTVNGRLFPESYVRECLAHPLFAIGSDGWRGTREGGPGEVAHHPNCWGWVPKVLGEYVRDERVLSLETAVWKITGYPAERLGLSDRGRVAPNWHADLMVFDPDTISTSSTFARPAAHPEGISEVFVNGRSAVISGRVTDARGGRLLT
jgi:N-acyl-D-amino-acid deacylase